MYYLFLLWNYYINILPPHPTPSKKSSIRKITASLKLPPVRSIPHIRNHWSNATSKSETIPNNLLINKEGYLQARHSIKARPVVHFCSSLNKGRSSCSNDSISGHHNMVPNTVCLEPRDRRGRQTTSSDVAYPNPSISEEKYIKLRFLSFVKTALYLCKSRRNNVLSRN